MLSGTLGHWTYEDVFVINGNMGPTLLVNFQIVPVF